MMGMFTGTMLTGRESSRECSRAIYKRVCEHSLNVNLHGLGNSHGESSRP